MKNKYLLMAAVGVAVCVLAGCASADKAAGAAAADVTAQAAGIEVAAAAERGAEAETGAEVTAAAEVMGEAEILVAAAASLKNAYEDALIPMFEDKYPGVTVEATYDSSGKLKTQIEEGLEADVFMSAATGQMAALDEEGLIVSDTITNLLENKIVLIVPSDTETALTAFEDIENAESIALGDPASVPAGQYAQEALTSLEIWDNIQDRISFGTNVTEVLNQVAAASADAGIVYSTDAAGMPDQVTVIAEAPEGCLAKKIIYPAAVVKTTAHEEAARNFVEFLKTDEAMAVFEAYGFTRGD